MEGMQKSQTLLSGMQLDDKTQETQIKPMKLHFKLQENLVYSDGVRIFPWQGT